MLKLLKMPRKGVKLGEYWLKRSQNHGLNASDRNENVKLRLRRVSSCLTLLI